MCIPPVNKIRKSIYRFQTKSASDKGIGGRAGPRAFEVPLGQSKYLSQFSTSFIMTLFQLFDI